LTISVKDLDEYCKKLLVAFITSNRKWNFNEFLDKLNKMNTKISRPTLSEHLKHLQRLRLITRKKEGKQRINYEVNWEKLKYLQKTIESQNALKRITENEKTFTSFPIEEQVMFLTNVLSLRDLQQLKLEILDTVEPDKNFEHNVQYVFTHQFFDLFRTWFVKNCYETSDENKLKALEMVENNIKHFEENLFIRKSWKSQNTKRASARTKVTLDKSLKCDDSPTSE
jgi:DNA-binding HxlR family transcriptional regulator